MTNKTIMKTILAVFSLMMLFNIGVSAQKVDCSKTTDADMVKAVYDKIKVKYANQMNISMSGLKIRLSRSKAGRRPKA